MAGPCTYLEFPGNAWQSALGGAEAAAALSESRKVFEGRAEGWGRGERVLRCSGHSLPLQV